MGGLIEIINLEDEVYLLCNEEGDLCSLPAEKMNYYEKMFYELEEFQKKEVQAKCILRFISID